MAQSHTPRPRINRVPAYLEKIQGYWFHGGQSRFAHDAGVSESTFSRIMRGQARNPRFRDLCRITDLIEQKLGCKLDPRDLYRM